MLNLKIVSLILSIGFLFNNPLYAEGLLRVPISDKTDERVSAALSNNAVMRRENGLSRREFLSYTATHPSVVAVLAIAAIGAPFTFPASGAQVPVTGVRINRADLLEQSPYISETPGDRIRQILSKGGLPDSEFTSRLARNLVRLGYLKSGTEEDEAVFVEILKEVWKLSKDIKFTEFNNMIALNGTAGLTKVARELITFLDKKGYLDARKPKHLNRLLIETFYPKLFTIIEDSNIAIEQKQWLVSTLVACTTHLTLMQVLVGVFDDVETFGATGSGGHTFLICHIKDRPVHLIVDASWGIVQEIDISSSYKAARPELSTHDTQTLFREGKYLVLRNKIERDEWESFWHSYVKDNDVGGLRVSDISKVLSMAPKEQLIKFFYPYFRAIYNYGATPLILVNISVALNTIGMYNEANEVCWMSRRLAPGIAESSVLQGFIRFVSLSNSPSTKFRLSDINQIIDAYRDAVRVAPYYHKAYANWGIMLASIGEHDEAIARWENWARTVIFPDELEKLLPVLLQLLPAERRKSAEGGIRKAYQEGPSGVLNNLELDKAWTTSSLTLHSMLSLFGIRGQI